MKSTCIILLLIFSFFTFESTSQNRLIFATDSSITILPEFVGFNNQMASSPEPWNDFSRKSALKKSAVGLLRYPGGTVSNYWDMEYDRLFQNSSEIDTSDNLPRVHLQSKNVIGWVVPMFRATNSIFNLKQAWSTMSSSNSAEPAIVFVLNMITPGADYYSKKWQKTIDENPLSDDWWAMMDDRLSRNIKMLDKVVSNGMKVKYIEFGNEYFFGKSNAGEGKNGGAIVEPYSAGAYNSTLKGAFPGNGKSYADAVNNWADTLTKRYPEVKLCAIGSDANSTSPSRRNSWNNEVVQHIDKEKVPAISLHVYNGVTAGNVKTSEENLGKAFASWKHHWEWIKQHSSLPNDREFWFTEYNNNKDKKTWGHGLLNLYNIHSWLMEGNLGLTNYHQFAQNSVSGSNIFASTRTFAMLAKATRGKTQAQQLKLADEVVLSGSGLDKIPALMAWRFKAENESKFTYFLTNFSSTEIEIDLSYISDASGAYYYYAKNPLATTFDSGEKIGMLNNSLKIPAYTCLYFNAGDIVPVNTNQIQDKSKSLNIYPNPGKRLFIETSNFNNDVLKLSIHDITGKKVFDISAPIKQIQNEVVNHSESLKSGIYIVRLSGKDFLESEKWIKK